MSKKIAVDVSSDHLSSLTVTTRPLTALAEVIWNSLDADAETVRVSFDRNALGGISAIRVSDDGSGIDYQQAEARFGSLGDSWKKNRSRTPSGRGLHGKNGKGRFRAFGLGGHVSWNTTSRNEPAGLVSYQIIGDCTSLKNFEITDPQSVKIDSPTGTEVVIDALHREFGALINDDAVQKASQEFAAYLAQNPKVVINYDGTILDPKLVQQRAILLECSPVTLSSGVVTHPAVRVVEWLLPVERSLHLCDETGVSRYEMKLGAAVRAPGFNFTAYLLSDAVRGLDSENRLMLEDSDADVKALLVSARKTLKDYFRKREAEDLSRAVSRWKDEKIYPYEDKAVLTPLEEAERQVFDIVAINVQEYLPDFEDARTESRRFTFRLLSQALKDNPDSLQEIIGQVLGLSKDAQDDLSELLKKTPLSEIIKAAKTVTDRLDFLTGLHHLVFDTHTKKSLLERDQLHRILNNEAWIFHEEFALAGSEKKLEEVLAKHLGNVGTPHDDLTPVEVAEGQTGRVDLLLHKTVQPRTGEFDYLVVELKRPSQKINSEILNQVERYAHAVSRDERFHGVSTRWTFIVISNEMDEFAKAKARQRDRPQGLVWDDPEHNIKVWAKTWAEVIGDAQGRLRFFRDQLQYEANRDTSRAYLEKVHAKFLPAMEPEPATPEVEVVAESSLVLSVTLQETSSAPSN